MERRHIECTLERHPSASRPLAGKVVVAHVGHESGPCHIALGDLDPRLLAAVPPLHVCREQHALEGFRRAGDLSSYAVDSRLRYLARHLAPKQSSESRIGRKQFLQCPYAVVVVHGILNLLGIPLLIEFGQGLVIVQLLLELLQDFLKQRPFAKSLPI